MASALAALIALLAALAAHDASANPFDPVATVSLADSAPGANSDITTSFDIDAPAPNFGAVVGFTPPEWGIASDADVTDGALVAELGSTATLGLINAPCVNTVPVRFDLLEATTNRSATTTFQDQFEDDDGNGIPNGAQLYPDYLSRILVDENDNPLQLRSRLHGQTNVSGTLVSINFAIFDPGVNLRGTQLDAALGFPSVIVLQALGDPASSPEPQPITDFCTKLLSSITTFGVTKDNPSTAANEGGAVFRTNPASDGTFNFMTFAASQRDADDDGFENSLDTCALQGNPDGFDPRVLAGAGDNDADGIPNVCDPTPDLNLPVNDADQDGYANRGDNCPTVANGLVGGVIIGDNNQLDTDSDGIGDACDNNPDSADGHFHETCFPTQITIGAGGPAPSGSIAVSGATCPRASVAVAGEVLTPTDTTGDTSGDTTGDTGGGDTGGGDTGGAAGGAATGVGSLAPAVASIPAWAAIASGLGLSGLLGLAGSAIARTLRRRR